jgi:hypothetical protein
VPRRSTEVPSSMRAEIRRVVLAIAAGLLLSAAVLTIIVVVNQGVDLSGCLAATPLGWGAILVAALVIAVAGRVLYSVGSRFDEGPAFETSVCTSCGRAVLDEWRLCPYCGSDKSLPVPDGPPGPTPDAPKDEPT